MKYYISASTDKGNRKEGNQDSLLVRKLSSANGEIVLAVLCDGMGGLQHGELASACVVSLFSKWGYSRLSELSLSPMSSEVIEKDWKRLVSEANSRIRSFGIRKGGRIGSTMTALLLTQNTFFLLNIGDSRAYRLNIAGISQLTRDHTLIAQEIARGNMTQEQAEHSKIRHMLTRCIGVEEHAIPDFTCGRVFPGDSFILCSDGFYHKISSQDVWNTIFFGRSMDQSEMKRRELVLMETDMFRGESDNISVITIHSHPDADPAQASGSMADSVFPASEMNGTNGDDTITEMMDDTSPTEDPDKAANGPFEPMRFAVLKDITFLAPADPRALAVLTD